MDVPCYQRISNTVSVGLARTKETLEIMLEIMQVQAQGFLKAEVHFISSFYSIAAMDGQTAEHLRQAICEYSRDEIFTVMCMGQNRGWEEAASVFSGSSIELKTCNAALLGANGKTWDEAFALAGFGGWKLHGIVNPMVVCRIQILPPTLVIPRMWPYKELASEDDFKPKKN